MKTITIYTILTLLLFWNCSGKKNPPKTKPKEKLWELKDGVFTQWYLGKVDTNGVRQGKWVFNNDQGKVRCVAMYQRDTLDGHQIVMYPNGVNHYIGEWKMGKKDGTWQTFNRKGEPTSTQVWKEGKLISTEHQKTQTIQPVK